MIFNVSFRIGYPSRYFIRDLFFIFWAPLENKHLSIAHLFRESNPKLKLNKVDTQSNRSRTPSMNTKVKARGILVR